MASSKPDGPARSAHRSARGIVLGLLIASLAVTAATHTGAKPAGCGAADALMSFRAHSATGRPGAPTDPCWRPYSAKSPFNRAIGHDDVPSPRSKRIVARLLAGGPVNPLVAGDPGRDGGVPVYVARRGDPVFTLHCTYSQWGRCEIEGDRIHIPDGAGPAGELPDPADDFDGHMVIVDPRTGREHDLWNVSSKPSGGGVLRFAWGGSTRLAGEGLGSDANAAGFGLLGGIIRASELGSGEIHHALAMVVPCTKGFVAPADGGGLDCKALGVPPGEAPPMGAHMRLDLTEQQIGSLGLPAWKEAIVRALAQYGAYVSDTTGHADQWGFEVESAADFRSAGKPDPFVQVARRSGIGPVNWDGDRQHEYVFNLASGVAWSRLEMLAPCGPRGSC